MAVDTIPVADIKIRDGFNVRQVNGVPLAEQEETLQLAESIKLLGVTTPVTIDTDGYLVAGERRYTAAKLAGITDIPYVLEDGDEKRKVAVHAVENIGRKQLSPAEEADAIGRLLKLGYTPDGVAQALAMGRALVTRRMLLLDIPEELRTLLWGPGGSTHLDVAAPLAALVTKVPKLAAVILYAERARNETPSPRFATQAEIDAFRDEDFEDEDFDEEDFDDDGDYWCPPAPSVEQLATSSRSYIARLREFILAKKGRGVPKWPSELILESIGARIGAHQLEDLNVPAAVREKFAEIQEKSPVYNDAMRIAEQDMDAARAAGVTVTLGGNELIFDAKWLKARIKSDMLDRFEQEITERNTRSSSTESSLGGEGRELSPYEQERKEKARREREKEKEWKLRAAAVNEELGVKLLTAFATVKADPQIVRIMAEASLRATSRHQMGSTSAAKLAAAGLRYVMPDWPTIVPTPTKANPNKTRTDYLPEHEAEAALWKWFGQAKTVEDIIGRWVIIHAAAMWANQHVVANSHRVGGHWSDTDAGYVELPKEVAEKLRKIVEKKVPSSVKKLREEIAAFAKQEADAERERSRAHYKAIQKARREYDGEEDDGADVFEEDEPDA